MEKVMLSRGISKAQKSMNPVESLDTSESVTWRLFSVSC